MRGGRHGPPRVCLALAGSLLVLVAQAQHDLAPEDEPEVARAPAEAEERKPPSQDLGGAAAAAKSEERPSVSTPAPKPAAGRQGSAPASQAEEAPAVDEPLDIFRQFRLEISGVVLLLVYFLTWHFGKARNASIARAWETACLEAYNQHFAAVGPNAGGGEKDGKELPWPGSALVREGLSSFQLLSRGRVHCTSCTTTLELAKRQDAAFVFLLSPFKAFVDMCCIDIALDNMDAFAFCVCRKSELKSLQASMADLRSFTRPRKVEELQDTELCILADSLEVAQSILQPQVVKVLKACEEWVHVLHISDVMAGGNRKRIRASFRMPGNASEMDAMASLVRLALYLIDVVAGLKLSEKARKQVAESRKSEKKAEEAAKRVALEQRIQQKKVEKKKQDEENLDKMTPEQQRKYEDLQYKKSLKARLPKMKMMK